MLYACGLQRTTAAAALAVASHAGACHWPYDLPGKLDRRTRAKGLVHWAHYLFSDGHITYCVMIYLVDDGWARESLPCRLRGAGGLVAKATYGIS